MDVSDYAGAIRRITRSILILGLLGALVAAYLKGLRSGLAFLIGAAVSYVSFWGWQQIVDALSPGGPKRSSWFFTLRMIALAAAAFVIIKFLGLNVAAAVTGLLVSAAAVILEMIYELIYA